MLRAAYLGGMNRGEYLALRAAVASLGLGMRLVNMLPVTQLTNPSKLLTWRAAHLGELNQGLSSTRIFVRLNKRNDGRPRHR